MTAAENSPPESARGIAILQKLETDFHQGKRGTAAIYDFEKESYSENVLAKTAIACRALSLEYDVGEDKSSVVFDAAFWKCVEILARSESPRSKRALATIARFSDLQTGDRIRFNTITGNSVSSTRMKDVSGD